MQTVAFFTLGCKVNQYETEAMIELFQKKDYTVVNASEKADIYVINTCTVTNLGDRKSRQFIRRSRKNNSEAVIAVVGCYSQVSPDEVSKIEGVDIILGTNDRGRVVELVERFKDERQKINLVEDIMQVTEFEELSINEVMGKTRANLKIQEGCNQYCSYCIIPYARGPIRSRKIENIIQEVRRLAQNGFKEVVLTGIHVASYGKDLEEGSLLEVIKEIHNISGIERIRLSSLEPTLITQEFMEEIVKLPKVCDHFHLSLQSGSDTVLKRMNRKYTTEEYKIIVKLIRKYMTKVAITTDIIVGFPGETNEEFEDTYNFVKEIGFSKIHVFKYSPRTGTPAAKLENQVHGNTKSHRSSRLIELGEKMAKDYLEKFKSKTLDVLFEQEANNRLGFMEGYTTNYIRTIVKGNADLEGKLEKVLIKEIDMESLVGKVII